MICKDAILVEIVPRSRECIKTEIRNRCFYKVRLYVMWEDYLLKMTPKSATTDADDNAYDDNEGIELYI